MDAHTLVTTLRSTGYLPALVNGKVRLYGDGATLPHALREAITANRAALVAYLHRPEQSIAYDLIDAAAEAGWFPRICDSTLAWWKGEERTANPMRSEALHDALEQHRDAVMAVLRQMPAGCRHRAHCNRSGICPAEIEESACTANSPEPPVATSDPPEGAAPEPPLERPYHRIWTCAGCHLPRSGDDRPCPGCGAVEGYVALRPANRFTALRGGSVIRAGGAP